MKNQKTGQGGGGGGGGGEGDAVLTDTHSCFIISRHACLHQPSSSNGAPSACGTAPNHA
jgi:hypothetical protein